MWSLELKAEDQLEDQEDMLESVEANMAELDIDKENVHDRKKWRENVIKRSPTISKMDYNR